MNPAPFETRFTKKSVGNRQDALSVPLSSPDTYNFQGFDACQHPEIEAFSCIPGNKHELFNPFHVNIDFGEEMGLHDDFENNGNQVECDCCTCHPY